MHASPIGRRAPQASHPLAAIDWTTRAGSSGTRCSPHAVWRRFHTSCFCRQLPRETSPISFFPVNPGCPHCLHPIYASCRWPRIRCLFIWVRTTAKAEAVAIERYLPGCIEAEPLKLELPRRASAGWPVSAASIPLHLDFAQLSLARCEIPSSSSPSPSKNTAVQITRRRTPELPAAGSMRNI